MEQTLESAKVRKKTKKKKPKRYKVQITFSSQDKRMIDRYCKINHVTPAIAIRRITKDHLKEVLPEVPEVSENQLELFGSVQQTMF